MSEERLSPIMTAFSFFKIRDLGKAGVENLLSGFSKPIFRKKAFSKYLPIPVLFIRPFCTSTVPFEAIKADFFRKAAQGLLLRPKAAAPALQALFRKFRWPFAGPCLFPRPQKADGSGFPLPALLLFLFFQAASIVPSLCGCKKLERVL